MWINIDTWTHARYLFDHATPRTVLGLRTGNVLGYYAGGAWQDFTEALSTGVSYHVVIVLDGTVFKGYVNGILTATLSVNATTLAEATSAIGAFNAGGGSWVDGKIDEVRLYNIALTQTEVNYLHNNPAGPRRTIKSTDVLGEYNIIYEPTEVISSVRVGYAKDWLTAGTQYTYFTDDSRETSVFTAYKTYKEQTFDTLLDTLSAATSYATTIYDYFDLVHGRVSVDIPMAYYELAIGDIINAEIQHPNRAMLGTTKSEVVGISYNLDRPAMNVGLRFV